MPFLKLSDMKKIQSFTALLLLFVAVWSVEAQEKHLTMEDAVLGYYKGLYPRGLQDLQWVKNKDEALYRDGGDFVFINPQGEEIRRISIQDFTASGIPLERLPYLTAIDGNKMVFSHDGTLYVWDYLRKESISRIAENEKGENTDYCMKNGYLAYTVENNLYISSPGKSGIPVTSFRDTNIVSGQAIHRNEFGIEKGTFWSPGGKYLAFYQKDESQVSVYPLVDITTYPASLKNIKYPMAGQKSEQAKVGIYRISDGKTLYLDIDTSDEHYLTNLAWSPDEKYILLAEVNRAQDHMWLNVYDATTGRKVRTLFEEQNDKWVEPETPARFLPGSNDTFLWMSERDGFMNLYLYHLEDGFQRQITRFQFPVLSILGFDGAGGEVFVSATGEDPKERQVFRVSLDGKTPPVQVTKPGGSHYTELSPSGKYLIDTYSSPGVPLKQGIICPDKKDCVILKEVENPLKDYPRVTMEFVHLKSNDGFPLHARMIKPADFDPSRKYPVLVYVYGGPHAQLVTDTWMGGAPLWMYYLAQEKGYIIFTLDGRGSANRGFAFESVIHRHQGKAAMEDQMTGVEYLKSLPYVDSGRMAIFGWSYGGFMTISMMLHHPGVFTTAVAGGPVTDWKYYEVMYGERYMDTPVENPGGYRETRLPLYIDRLKGRLLVIHGSVDPVVVPQHSLTLLKAAVDKNIPIDFFTYPMHEHNVRGRDRVHLMEKVAGYILEHNK